jgi:hypothetical protein
MSRDGPVSKLAPALAFLALYAAAAPTAWAEEAAVAGETASTATAAIEAAFDAGARADLAVLDERGASFERVLVLEALPRRDHYAAEIALKYGDVTLRYPVALQQHRVERAKEEGEEGSRRCPPRWSVRWTPKPVYARGLLNMIDSGALPGIAGSTRVPGWTEGARLPALPVIVTRVQLLTPFGDISLVPASERRGEDDRGGGGGPATLAPPEELGKHIESWFVEVLGREPGAAAVDLICDRRVRWETLTRVIFGVASAGMYRLSILTRSGTELGALEATAPVRTAAGDPRGELVVALYSLGGGDLGARIARAGEVVEATEPCAPEMSFCPDGPDDFIAELGRILAGDAGQADAGQADAEEADTTGGEGASDAAGDEARSEADDDAAKSDASESEDATASGEEPEGPTRAMFASHAGVSLEQLVPYLARLAPALGLPAHRIVLGFIRRN